MSTRRTHWVWATAAVAVLTLTTGLYTRPEVAIALAEQFWACFGI